MSRSFLSLATVGALAAVSSMLPACSGGSGNGDPNQRVNGQSDFVSAPPVGSGGGGGGASFGAGGADNAGAAPTTGGAKGSATVPQQRTMQETDLYRLEGNRLYYLNAYRGLMVFDVTNVDQPKLLGRSAIYGTPIDMIVNKGVAVVVVSDWYGTMQDGTPFHGSIVRGLDANDPTNIRAIGDAYLGGEVTDTRVVGNVLYAVSEDYGWEYGGWVDGYAPGFGGGVAAGASSGGVADGVATGVGGSASGEKVIVSSVSFAGNQIKQTGYQEFSGYSAIFNVTPNAIMLAHDIPSDPTQQYSAPSGKSVLQYVDISDPGGAIKVRGSLQANGSVQGWGADNGRWNVDFADGKIAHLLACNGTYCGGTDGFTLTTADFTNPDAPIASNSLPIAGTGWNVATRFDAGRMYLSPSDGYYDTTSGGTPLEIFDLSNPASPTLAGQTSLKGTVWLLMPNGNQLFALGNDTTTDYTSTQVSLRYFDVTDAHNPTAIGQPANFGNGWAWTPAAGTFKAFIKDNTQGLVVLPFSGWDYNSYTYNNGVQLIQYSPTAITTAGAAHTHGWVERGIFVNGRIVSLSDLALSVVDYSDRMNPKVVSELTLARNVVSAKPNGGTIAELSSDWWENDTSNSELRVLPTANADETADTQGAVTAKIPGVDARSFNNGNFTYVVTQVQQPVDCGVYGGGPGSPSGGCTAYVPQVQVVDLSNGGATPRGTVTLPVEPNSYSWWGWGWGGFYYYDWYDGSDAIQIGGDMIAFRRWYPVYNGTNGSWTADQQLYVVDLSNPDHPSIASTLITPDSDSWWGNMRAVGDTLYTSHYEWVDRATSSSPYGYVKYYLDRIDLSDRAHPKVGSKINVPGMLVGASATDPNTLYTIDYRWDSDIAKNDIDVIHIDGNRAHLQGSVRVDGWVGNVFIQNNSAYMSTETYVEPNSAYDPNAGPRVNLHQIDLSNPSALVDHATTPQKGWGWLLGVQGDRAILTSGWGSNGVDIYKLTPNAVPTFDQFVRTNGWWTESLSRQDNQLFLSSGYWGVQTVTLKP